MADVLVEFDTVLTASDGSRWVPRACGRPGPAGLWEGWIEFLAMADAQEPVRTATESTQPNRDDLMYWAQGLTAVYLEGALARALEESEMSESPSPGGRPAFSGPVSRPHVAGGSARRAGAILNPFEVYEQGQDVLIGELGALPVERLRDIAIAYGFANTATLDGAGREELTAIIVGGVRRPLRVDRDHSDMDLST